MRFKLIHPIALTFGLAVTIVSPAPTPAAPKPTHPRRRSVMKTVLVASTAILAFVIGPANATPVLYTFMTDASVTAGPSILHTGEYTERLSGGFTYDPATDKMTNVDIFVTGSGPESNTYTSDPITTYKKVGLIIYSGGNENNPGGNEEFLLGGVGGTEIFIGFAEGGTGLPNDLAYFNYSGAYFQNLPSKTYVHSVNGGVEVPEPSSLAMLSVGLVGLAGLSAVRRKRLTEAATDMFDLQPPRHTSILPI